MKKPVYDSPEAAELAFYSAFEDADLEGMMGVWARQAEIECIHPFGERLQGTASVSKSWQQLFKNGKQLRFQLDQISSTTDAQLAVHVLHENITVAGNTTAQGHRYQRLPLWRIRLAHDPAPCLAGIKAWQQYSGEY